MIADTHIEALYAEDGAAFTLRFETPDQALDVTIGGALVGRLFDRWWPQGPRAGLRRLPLISPDDAAALKAADDQFQFGHCAPGYVHVLLATGGRNFECRVEGLVGMDVVYPDAACERDARGRTTLREDLHPGFAGLREAQWEDLVSIADGHPHSSVVSQHGVNAESGAGDDSAPDGAGNAVEVAT